MDEISLLIMEYGADMIHVTGNVRLNLSGHYVEFSW
jgi:hypothetical protein